MSAQTAGSKKLFRTGIVLSTIPVLFLTFDTVIHFLNIAPVTEAMARLGYPLTIARTLGVIELACLVFYLIPRTALLGAILLTGFLGGAVATHVRIGDPLFSHILFPTYVAALIWAGLVLRDARLRRSYRKVNRTTDSVFNGRSTNAVLDDIPAQ